jgi:hypothetical protein
MLKYSPSVIASSALFLGNKILQKPQDWTSTLETHSCYSSEELTACAGDMCILLRGIENCSLQGVRKKFLKPEFHKVANIRISN